MTLHSFANFKLIMSRHRKELRGALSHGLCVNPSLTAIPPNQNRRQKVFSRGAWHKIYQNSTYL